MRHCRQVLEHILEILRKPELTEQDLQKIIEVIDTFLRNKLQISISLKKFEQLCTTACYMPDQLIEKSRSRCAKFLIQLRREVQQLREKYPIPEEIHRNLLSKVESFLEELKRKYVHIGSKQLRELERKLRELTEENIKLREECEYLRRCVEECEVLRGEVERLRDLSVSYAGRVLDLEGRLRRCRRRVRELSRRVRSCESTVEGLNSVLELLWRENERLEELVWVWFQEYRIASTERDIYISLVASLSGTIARLLDENEKLSRRVRELEDEVSKLRSRVNELENSFLGFIATIREIGSELPDKIRRRLLKEVGKHLLQ